jgi:hypothetical protein
VFPELAENTHVSQEIMTGGRLSVTESEQDARQRKTREKTQGAQIT